MDFLIGNTLKREKTIMAYQWVQKNCCLHPTHDLVNAVLYLGSLGLNSALGLLNKVRRELGGEHTCKHCPECAIRYSVH